MKTMLIGNVAKAQGIKGEIKVTTYTDCDDRFKKLDSVVIGGIERKVLGVKILHNGVFLTLEGIDDRNAAEMLRGQNIEIAREKAVKLPNDRHFIVDLVGSEVFIGDKSVGILEEIIQNGSADVYLVKGKKEFMFPAVRDVFLEINTKEKKIVLDKLRFMEICVYED